MNPLTARRKGIEFEQRLVRALGKIYGPSNIRRNYQGGPNDTLPDITGPDIYVEAKCGRNPPFYSALQQAIQRAGDPEGIPEGNIPFAAFHLNGQNRHQPREFVAMLRLEDLLRLLADRNNLSIATTKAAIKAAIAELHRHPTKKKDRLFGKTSNNRPYPEET